MKTEPLPGKETIEINVDGSTSSFPPSLSLLPSASGVRLHIRDVEEIEGDAFFSQRRSLAAPVAKQVALLTALKLH